MKTTMLLAGMLALCAAAQTPTEPPRLIQVVRAPGIAAAPIRQYSAAGGGINVFGMVSITGASETWQIELHDSFVGIEALDQALGPAAREDMPGATDTAIALYRERWSFRPEQAFKLLPRSRYLQISVYRIRAGAGSEFSDLMRARNASLDRANLDMPGLAYQVTSGSPAGACVILTPLASLRTIDSEVTGARFDAETSAIAAWRAANKAAADAGIERENRLFRLDPRLSHLSEDLVSADPSFWAPGTREP
jgi:hypothetical protein